MPLGARFPPPRSSSWALSKRASSWTGAELSPVPSSITPSTRQNASSREDIPISAGMCQLRLGQTRRKWTTGFFGRCMRNIVVKDPFPYTGKGTALPFFLPYRHRIKAFCDSSVRKPPRGRIFSKSQQRVVIMSRISRSVSRMPWVASRPMLRMVSSTPLEIMPSPPRNCWPFWYM